jgi:hypothetical protein
MKPELTQEELKRVLHYEPETGIFTWLVRLSNRAPVGKHANSKMTIGYITVRIHNAPYLGHRLAWFYMTGEWPQAEIDHINGISDDNRWCNLRPATHQQNLRNTRKRADNTSGRKGVRRDRRSGKWYVNVRRSDGSRYYASFLNLDLAAKDYERVAREIYGEFARFE